MEHLSTRNDLFGAPSLYRLSYATVNVILQLVLHIGSQAVSINSLSAYQYKKMSPSNWGPSLIRIVLGVRFFG